ncbi:MAG: hypothetical protein JNK72_13845 [Myxococcales bacterium]|nr:hypothetical protein [Myxococcales bacterium]
MENDKTEVAPKAPAAVVEKSHVLREQAVAHARSVFDALGLPDAPVSPDAPPAYPPAAPALRAVAAPETAPETVSLVSAAAVETAPETAPEAVVSEAVTVATRTQPDGTPPEATEGDPKP